MQEKKEKQDVRTIKTIETIYSAFLTLMERKPFQGISVKAICQSARVSRSTFYDHFEDKYDLVRHLLHDMSRAIAPDLVFFKEDDPAKSPIFALEGQYRKLLNRILHEPENQELFQIYRRVIADDMCEKIRGMQPVEGQPLWLDVAAEFYAGAIISVLTLWLDAKSRETQEEMVRCINILLETMPAHVQRLRRAEAAE